MRKPDSLSKSMFVSSRRAGKTTLNMINAAGNFYSPVLSQEQYARVLKESHLIEHSKLGRILYAKNSK